MELLRRTILRMLYGFSSKLSDVNLLHAYVFTIFGLVLIPLVKLGRSFVLKAPVVGPTTHRAELPSTDSSSTSTLSTPKGYEHFQQYLRSVSTTLPGLELGPMLGHGSCAQVFIG